MKIFYTLAFLSGMANAAAALDVAMPETAKHIAAQTRALKLYDFPKMAEISSETPLVLQQNVWQIRGSDLTVQQIFDPIKDGQISQGISAIYECSDVTCGGFDFRYNLNLIQAPDMHVALDDYVYWVGANRDQSRYVEIVVSHASQTGFVHISEYSKTGVIGTTVTPVSTPDEPTEIGSNPLESLQSTGAWTLQGLAFKSGSSEFLRSKNESIAALATTLKSNPDIKLRLVGHTDLTGDYDVNVALSKKRAEAVKKALIENHGIGGSRLISHGVGPLAPRFSNATKEGRQKNRRVEVIFTSTLRNNQ